MAMDAECKHGMGRPHRVLDHASRPRTYLAAVALASGLAAGPAWADQVVSCGGVAMAGGAELVCSHTLPSAPPQFCTYSWALMTTSGSVSTAQGTFLIAPGMADDTIYQGWGFSSALSNPIVLCQGRHR